MGAITQTGIAQEYIDRFPKFPSMSIARKIARDHPMRFTIEQARCVVRRARGNMGEHNRNKTADKSKFRPPQKSGDPFGQIPRPKSEYRKTWGAVKINVNKALVLSDIQIPFHDRDALTLALRHGLDKGCDSVILNGDICDFFRLSYFRKDITVVEFREELDIIKRTLAAIRDIFPDAQIYFKDGNHEERLESYLQVRAPELLGIPDFTIRHVLRLDDLGMKHIGDKRPLKIDHLYIIHGHEFAHSTYNPVNPARGYFLQAKTICLGAHHHQTSEHTETDLEQKVTSVWSTGCLCNLHPKWMPINKWNHGFAVVDVARKRFCVDNLKIIKGQVF